MENNPKQNHQEKIIESLREQETKYGACLLRLTTEEKDGTESADRPKWKSD